MATITLMMRDRVLKSVEISKTVTTIGRSRECDLQLDNPIVSRLHARVQVGPSGFMLIDNDSTGGLFINGERTSHTLLREGLEFHIGKFAIIFSLKGGVPMEALQRVAAAPAPMSGVVTAISPDATMALGGDDMAKMRNKLAQRQRSREEELKKT